MRRIPRTTTRARRGALAITAGALAGSLAVPLARPAAASAADVPGRIAAGGVISVHVPEAVGAKTVVGQLTVDGAIGAGFVTAYGCRGGAPIDATGAIARSDLNVDGRVSAVASNRLVVQADDSGDVCFYTSRPAALIVDLNGVTFDTGMNSFANRRTDTRGGPLVGAGGVVRMNVPEARGGRMVVGQLTVDGATTAGFVTAYGCADGLPVDAAGHVTRSDLNYLGGSAPIASNRLLAPADTAGDVCFYTSRPVAMVLDVNATTDVGITAFANRRTDTRTNPPGARLVAARSITRLNVPEAMGNRTVIGELTVDRATNGGFVTAFGCADGIPTDNEGGAARSDLNFDGHVSPVASNRLVVRADAAGDVCFYTSQAAALVIDVNGVAGAGLSSFPNRRIDTRTGSVIDAASGIAPDGTRSWPPFTPAPPLRGVAALTGAPADAATAARPVLAAKIDNYGAARPQWALDRADGVIELNVEGISRFIALYQSQIPDTLGPVRSARTADLDLLSAMNRPVFAYSGANDGVLQWTRAADAAGLIDDFGAQVAPCYSRSDAKPGPHNLLLDPTCAYAAATAAGPARAPWVLGAAPALPTARSTADGSFDVAMDGVAVQWRWDATSGTYRRSQDGEPHVAMDGVQLSASSVAVVAVNYVPSVADARSPDAVTVGVGAAVVHRQGRAYRALWSRPDPTSPFRFFDAVSGDEIPLATGRNWLELTRA